MPKDYENQRFPLIPTSLPMRVRQVPANDREVLRALIDGTHAIARTDEDSVVLLIECDPETVAYLADLDSEFADLEPDNDNEEANEDLENENFGFHEDGRRNARLPIGEAEKEGEDEDNDDLEADPADFEPDEDGGDCSRGLPLLTSDHFDYNRASQAGEIEDHDERVWRAMREAKPAPLYCKKPEPN